MVYHMRKEELFEDLRRRIISGELLPGQWLVERDLSEEYKISRTPIREKLRKLANLGLVELEPSRGYRVKELGVEEIVEIFNAREAIEGECTRLACLSGSSEFLIQVKELKARLESIDIQREPERGVIIGKELHDLIVQTANNRYLEEFYQKLANLAALTRNMSKKSSQIEMISKDFHLRILDALLEKNAEEGERLMREHLRFTCKALLHTYLRVGVSI